MLDLNARVDLDEVEGAVADVVEELHRTSVLVACGFGQTHGGLAHALPGVFVEPRGRGHFHDLLIAALHRAVALEQMGDVAVGVADDLHLDVAGVLDQLFEVDVILAESSGRFALGDGDFFGELVGVVDPAHAASTAAPAGLDHDRQADFLAGCIRSSVAVGQGVRRRNGWDVGGFRELARGDLVTQIDEGLGARADECDASGVCGGGQLGRF